MKVEVLILDSYDVSWGLPSFATKGAAGVDFRSTENAFLKPLERKAISTGICVALPVKTELQMRPRSGLALKEGITLLNSPGTIDSDYRGEIKAILINLSERQVEIKRGDRIAQGIFALIEQPIFVKVETLDETERGSNGFGSTGKS